MINPALLAAFLYLQLVLVIFVAVEIISCEKPARKMLVKLTPEYSFSQLFFPSLFSLPCSKFLSD